MNTETLIAETRAILAEGGAQEMLVRLDGDGWLVAFGFSPGVRELSNHTGQGKAGTDDPRELARIMLAEWARRWKPKEPPAPAVASDQEMGESLGDDQGAAHPADDHANASEGFAGGPVPESDPVDDAGRDRVEVPIDADFSEPDPIPPLEGEDLNAPGLPEPESLGEEILATEERGGVAYFGDNLPTMRLKKLGRLAQIAAERIAVITSEIGWDDEEFDRLQGYVVRQTVGGTFSGDQVQYDRFVSMSQAWGHIRAIQLHRDNGTVFLNAAERPEVEGFDPEAGWP